MEPFGQPSMPLTFLITLVYHISSLVPTCLMCWTVYWLARKRKFKNMKDKSYQRPVEQPGQKTAVSSTFYGSPLAIHSTATFWDERISAPHSACAIHSTAAQNTLLHIQEHRWLQTGVYIYTCIYVYVYIYTYSYTRTGMCVCRCLKIKNQYKRIALGYLPHSLIRC